LTQKAARISLVEMQKRRISGWSDTILFVATHTRCIGRQALANGRFRQTDEKVSGRNDAGTFALSASYAQRIVSETMAFLFFHAS
jgi:hypothetical protein